MDPIVQKIKRNYLQGCAALCLVLSLATPNAWGAMHPDDGDDSYRFLAGLVDKGLFDLAAKEGNKFLEQHASHPKADLARFRLAGALFELKRNPEAAGHYAKLAKLEGFEYRAESNFRLGQCQLDAGQLDAAKQAFREVQQLGQAYLNGPATFFLGETEFRQGDLKAAEAHYASFLKEHKDAEYLAAARRGLVWCAWKSQATELTIQRAKDFLKRHGEEPGSDEMRILLGEALLEQDQPQEALLSFREVRSQEYGDAHRRGAGFALAAQGEHAAAAGEFALLLRDFPKSRFAAEARLQLGLQALRSGNTEAALRALTLATRDRDPEAYYWLAEAQRESGDSRAALGALEAALKLDPEAALQARIHGARGDLLSALGRSDEALAAYSESGSDYALYAAAVTSLNEGDHGRAVDLVERMLQLNPKSKYRLQALLVRGEAHFSAGRGEQAIAAFREVLENQPEGAQAAQAMARIAWSHYQAERPAEALASFERLVQTYPQEESSQEGLYMLGRIALELGQKPRALEAGRSYLKRYSAGAQRAEVLFACGQAESAEASLPYFERLIREQPEHDLVAAALLELGDRRSKLGQLEAAMLNYQELLQSQPNSELLPEARYGLGWCLYSTGNFQGSAEQLNQAAGHRRASKALRGAALELAVWAHSKAGDPLGASAAWRALRALGGDQNASFESLRTVLGAWSAAQKPQQAQGLLQEFLQAAEDPELTTKALLESAYLALESGDLALAESRVQRAEDTSRVVAGVAEACFFVGEARFAEGDHERAAKLYQGALREPNPMHANAFYKLGFALMEQGDMAAAAEAFGGLVEQHAESELFGEALFLRGEAQYQLKALEACILSFGRLLKEAPEHQVLPKALFRMGIAQGQLERWPECETSLTLLARKAPEFPNLSEAELWRGRALAAQRKRRAARQAFERVLSLDKGELAARARLGIGKLLEAEGRGEEALSEYLKVAYLYAHDEEVAEALFRAGTCLEAQGNREQASAQYEEVLAKHPKAAFASQAKQRLSELGRGS